MLSSMFQWIQQGVSNAVVNGFKDGLSRLNEAALTQPLPVGPPILLIESQAEAEPERPRKGKRE